MPHAYDGEVAAKARR